MPIEKTLYITCAIFFTCLIPLIAGLSCVECIDARSDEDCIARGSIRECEYDQNACGIEIREHEGWGGYKSITKQCKQEAACFNNHAQNPREAWWPTQCNEGNRNSVCRCCCFTDMCNVDKESCFGPVSCSDPLRQIHDGRVYCTNGTNPGSECRITCNWGARLVGNSKSYCSENGNWIEPLARCEAMTCRHLEHLQNGLYICSKQFSVGSRCRPQCQEGFLLRGPPILSCTIRGIWGRLRRPICIPITCPEWLPIADGEVRCSNGRSVHSICRVACNSGKVLDGAEESHCKKDGTWSQEPPTCKEINCRRRRRILFGSGSCTNSNRPNSNCSFICNDGFILKGSASSSCLPGGKWSTPIPLCTRITCPPRRFLAFGRVRCTSGYFAGSICRYTCNPGAILIGQEESQCTSEGVWTSPLPFCQVLECTRLETLANGFTSCTDENFVGSRCTFRCGRSRRLMGSEMSTCQESAQWSNPLPSCERIECSGRGSVEGGSVECTDENFAGSRCTVTCDPDKRLSGEVESICLDSGKWSATLAECEKRDCPTRSLFGGKVECTNSNLIGSACTVSCQLGKRLSGGAQVKCTASREWDKPLPSCLDIKCNERGKVIGGEIECTNTNYAGSICTVVCDTGRLLVGTQISICLDSEEWSTELPTCERIRCPLRESVENGEVECTDSFYQGSSCSVKCAEYYELVGEEISTCLQSGTWDFELPFCQELSCEPRGSVLFASVHCSHGNMQSSVCQVTCDENYTLVGASMTECLPSLQWSNELPACEANVCPPREVVENGVVYCDRGQRIDSVCSVICNVGARLLGFGSSECLESGDWSAPLPTCQPISCEDQGSLEHGKITCTDGNRVRSICSFECTEKDYELFPTGRGKNFCQRNERWTVPKPCCAKPCPPWALIDLVVVLDSSSSIGAENWVMLTSFVEGILRSFRVGRTSANFAIFRYNRVVDEESQIFLNSHPTDINELIRAFNDFEYNGSGTRTGNALRHAKTVSLAAENGNRPNVNDVVLVITDGAASDDVITPAEELREMGVTILVLGIQPPRGYLDLVQLRQIAEKDENLIIAESGFSGLTSEFAIKLSHTICGEPCK